MNAQSPAKQLWRSLDELEAPAAARANIGDEFMPAVFDVPKFDRRRFLKVMGASMALASLPACTRQPVERIVPYVDQPEQLVPGKPLYFATAMAMGGFATGLLVESHEGHPTKIEGNPGHPASLGATGIFHQAALLDLYGPHRSKSILNQGKQSNWKQFAAILTSVLQAQEATQGQGIRILTETITSPTLHGQIQQFLQRFPKAKWHQYEPVNRDGIKAGSELAFGEFVETHHHFEKANVIVSLDSDFLQTHPQCLAYTRAFADKRRARTAGQEMNRFYSIESAVSITGANADHRLPLAYSEIVNFAVHLRQRIQGQAAMTTLIPAPAHERFISAVAADLSRNRGNSIVIAGENLPPIVHALVHLINDALGNVGSTVSYSESAECDPVHQLDSLRDLTKALTQGEVDVLVMLGGNAAFSAPADFEFAEAMSKAKLRIHLSREYNETSKLCDWHIPESHFLESWGDGRSFDGTVSIIQPLILPLYESKSAYELLEAMNGRPDTSDYDVVHGYWQSHNPENDFESKWRCALHDGLVQDSSFPTKQVSLRHFEMPAARTINSESLEATFRPDPTVWDGRHAGNGWLQELPKPITKLVWDTAAHISPALAQRQHLANGDVIEIIFQNENFTAPVWVVPGQPENAIGLHFGYGRSVGVESVAATGFNAYPLRTSEDFWNKAVSGIKKTGKTYKLVTTQIQHAIDSEERQILREGSFAEFAKHPDFVHEDSEAPSETLFNPDEFKYDGYRWGMSIDLSACIGCSACVIACQAENNIPVVGKTEVSRGRVMHWIRVDSYFRGDAGNPSVTNQPVPCMHCENAPCELVCPVGATLHDKEGLNLQVYNRCVGTRYCSNNCPYKVRRFNFFQYADYQTPVLVLMRNPDVTVRWRGVMEKCTYCIQRISEARITSEEQGRTIADGEIQTACQQVCPAKAIVFGNIADPQSHVSNLKSHPLNYLMLGQLNTRPRTTYLAKLRNPNSSLES